MKTFDIELSERQFQELKNATEPLVRARSEKRNHLQSYLAFQYEPFFNYTESIILLCKAGKYNAASVLLRSLIEGHINVIYYQLGDSDKKLACATRSMFHNKRVQLENFLALIKDHPNQESPDPKNLFSKAYLETAIAWTRQMENDIIQTNKLAPEDIDPKQLEAKARACDEVQIANAEPGYFRRMYNLEYRFLSPAAHLNIQGLEHFVDQDEGGGFVFRDTHNGGLMAANAVGLCAVLVKDLFEHKVISGDMPNVIKEIEATAKSAS